MASFENEQTIETDSDEPRSPFVQSSHGGQTKQNLDVLTILPQHLQIDNTDAIIINSEEDRENALKFQKRLVSEEYTHDGKSVKLKVKLLREIPGSEHGQLSQDIVTYLERTSYIFLFASKSLCERNSVLSQLESILLKLLPSTEKQCTIIPVNTKKRKDRDYELPAMYSGVKAIESWSLDRLSQGAVKDLLRKKIQDRLRRDKELDIKRRKYYDTQNAQRLKETGNRLQSMQVNISRLTLQDNVRSQGEIHKQLYQQQRLPPNSGIELDGPLSQYQGRSANLCGRAHESLNAKPGYGLCELPVERNINMGFPATSSSTHQAMASMYTPASLQSGSHVSYSQFTSSLEVQAPSSLNPHSRSCSSQSVQTQSVISSIQPHPYHHQNEVLDPGNQMMADHHNQVFAAGRAGCVNLPRQEAACLNKPFSQECSQLGSKSAATNASHHSHGKNLKSHSHSSSKGANSASASCFTSTFPANVTNITYIINADSIGNAVIGHNATLVSKSCKISSEDESSDDSASSECSLNRKETRQRDVPIPAKGTACSSSSHDIPPTNSRSGKEANREFYPPLVTQPQSPINQVTASQNQSDFPGLSMPSNVELTRPGFFVPTTGHGHDATPNQFIYNPNIHATQVKQVVDDESEPGDDNSDDYAQTQVKKVI